MPAQSYSIYRGVEDEDEAELRVEESPEVTKKSPRRRRKLWDLSPWQKFLIIAIVTGCIAFLLGFLVTRRPCPACDINGDSGSDYEPQEREKPKMDWTEMKSLLFTTLNDGQTIEKTVREISGSAHPAGSARDRDLADVILQRFRASLLDNTWMENHYAELQFPNRSSPNSLMIVNTNDSTRETVPIEDAELYCPYSAVGTVKGGLVYANYGRKDDFRDLSTFSVSVPGNLVIVRTGYITFAEKVNNAELAGAVGVLIFPDTAEVPLYGHVHLGTGDPNTPGFPSFNHTQFPPFRSSGLPKIPAQPIGRAAAQTLLSKLSGSESPSTWRSPSFPSHRMGPRLLREGDHVQLRVTNLDRSTELVNVFGSITGGLEPEHYIVVGAQRDSWGPGAAKSGVGTAILLELARSMGAMVRNGFQPRRSILFVSWDGGDFGSIGATEWLEGYLSMLHLKAATYMNLDCPVLGDEKFVARSSPLFKSLIENIIKQVENPRRAKQTIYDNEKSENSNWQEEVLAPLTVDTASFAFTAFAGVPALEFSFLERSAQYQYLDTKLDTYDSLNAVVTGRLPAVVLAVAEVAGLCLIRLSHDKILPMEYTAYNSILTGHLRTLVAFAQKLKVQGLTLSWLYSARGDYMRATERLKKQIGDSDLRNEKVVQFFNVRIMRVEFYFLSQYVSAINSPYRHVLIGRGNHTLAALIDNLGRERDQMDAGELHKQVALFTWTLVGAANALSGEVWEVHRNF